MKTVAIIGGGITGLTAAFRLRQRGLDATVYEAGPRVGGVIQSIRRDGYLAEFGPNSILETSPRIGDLIRDLGLEKRKIYTNSGAEKRYIVRDRKLVEVPGSPLAFVTADLFSWKAKAHLAAEPFVRRCAPDVEESLEQFVLRRLGREFLDYAINPLVAGIYAGNPARLSVKHAFPKLHALEQEYGSLICGQILGKRKRARSGEVSKQNAKKFSFDDGLQVLTDALAENLKGHIHLQSPVLEVAQFAEGWSVHTPRGFFVHDAILFCAPAHKLAGLKLAANPAISFSSFAEIQYPPVTSLVFGFQKDQVSHPLDGFGVLIPEVEKMNSLGAIFSSALFPQRAPEGHVTITVYAGGSRNPALALADRSQIRRLALKDLTELLGVRGAPTFEHYTTFRDAIPQYEIGYGRFKDFMQETEQRYRGLFFAGHYRDGISLSDSIVSADKRADEVTMFCNSIQRQMTENVVAL